MYILCVEKKAKNVFYQNIVLNLKAKKYNYESSKKKCPDSTNY
jgi:hypothetical protein